MTSMFEKCTGLTSLDISTFHPTMNEQYTKMFYGCSNLEYVNFYNYYENENTIFNDIITNAHPNIILCIHVKREARIYLSYPEHLDIECLRPDIDPTTIIITTTIPIKKETTIITTVAPIKIPTTIITTTIPIKKETTIVTTNTPTEKETTIITTSSPTEKETNIITTSDPTEKETNIDTIITPNEKTTTV